MRLSDAIEAFIKALMDSEDEEGKPCELQRNELAEYFHCAPSQINYVLSTRFTPDHGYSITSQRGGGGYVRIVRISRTHMDGFTYFLRERIGDSVDEQRAMIICRQLAEQGLVTQEEALLMASAVSRKALSVPVPEAAKNVLRARILGAMLLQAMQNKDRKKETE